MGAEREPMSEKRHTYLLDTNILMNYPTAVYGFDDNEVVVTATTIEELDSLKQGKTERACQAREVFRQSLTPLRQKALRSHADLAEGVKINRGRGIFRVENDSVDAVVLPQGWELSKADNRILAACCSLGAILVTEDQSLLFKASEIGVPAQEYRNAQIPVDENCADRAEVYVSAEEMNILAREGQMKADGRKTRDLVENEYLILHDRCDPKHTFLARFRGGMFHRLYTLSDSCRVTPRNVSQHFAIDALMAPPEEIPLVILQGEAGTAKTFLTVACGMDQMEDRYERMIATRNNVEFDRDIGALPGSEVEKVGPLMRGVTDNLRTYLKIQGGGMHTKRPSRIDAGEVDQIMEDYLESGRISIESMGFMRGRSITNSYIIIDECQNATPGQIMGIVTRAAEGSKIVLCGDPNQIDKLSLTANTAGLTFAARAMAGSPACARVVFSPEECERSFLAREAAERMTRRLAQ